jgi:hypothetical protein
VKFLDQKIEEQGEGEEVLADPDQMLALFAHLRKGEGR